MVTSSLSSWPSSASSLSSSSSSLPCVISYCAFGPSCRLVETSVECYLSAARNTERADSRPWTPENLGEDGSLGESAWSLSERFQEGQVAQSKRIEASARTQTFPLEWIAGWTRNPWGSIRGKWSKNPMSVFLAVPVRPPSVSTAHWTSHFACASCRSCPTWHLVGH